MPKTLGCQCFLLFRKSGASYQRFVFVTIHQPAFRFYLLYRICHRSPLLGVQFFVRIPFNSGDFFGPWLI